MREEQLSLLPIAGYSDSPARTSALLESDWDSVETNQEILEARKIYKKKSWEITDVSRKSVEEIAANIIALYRDKK